MPESHSFQISLGDRITIAAGTIHMKEFQRVLHLKGWMVDHRKKAFDHLEVVIDQQHFRAHADKKQTKLHQDIPIDASFQIDIHLGSLKKLPERLWIEGLYSNGQSVKTEPMGFRYGFLYTGEDAQLQRANTRLLNDLYHSVRENYELKQSISWKTTAPIRSAMDGLAKVQKLVKLTRISLQDDGVVKTFSRMGSYLKDPERFKHPGEMPQTIHYETFRQRSEGEIESAKDVLKKMEVLRLKPLISIIVPTYNTRVDWLDECVQSVLDQTYPHWELCIYDDASTSEETLSRLKRLEKADDRIKVVFGKDNLHISKASNKAAEMCSGEFIGLLDHDDLLRRDALWEVVKLVNEKPELDFIYSDEDKLEANGSFVEPYFKPDYNPDLLLSNNYINHFSVFRKALFEKVGGFRKGFEGSQDHDLLLRFTEHTSQFGHISKVLYHWRKVAGSTAERYAAKSYPEQAAIKALKDHLKRTGSDASVERGLFPGSFRVKRAITTKGTVSIIIPFKDQVDLLKVCLNSLEKTVQYPHVEIVLVNNNSEKAETLEYLDSIRSKTKVLDYPKPFNFSAINNFAAEQASGEFLLFLNNDIEAVNEGWLEAMLEHIQRPEVGAVGAKLLYPDRTIQHAGVILGIGGVAGHSHKYYPGNHPGYFYRSAVIQNLSACTAACLMVKRSVFEEIKGFDADNLRIAFNDVDLCLKIRTAGHLIVYTPFAELIHHESKSRGAEDTPEKVKRFNSEIDTMRSRWGTLLDKDPYYNPNLSLTHEDFRLRMN